MQIVLIICLFPLICLGYTVANTTMNFIIRTFWNSTPIIGRRLVHLALSSTADKNSLLIKIDAPFFGDPAPPSALPGSFPGLWNYEVVELFFLASSTNHYIELEFSPHGHYLVLLLTNQHKILKQMLPLLDYHVEHVSSDRWIGRVHVPRAHFPGRVDRFNAYAIHGQDKNRTYEALYPAPPQSNKPDLHRLELFQPLNFQLLLNQSDQDGESWNNHASHSASFSFLAPIILFLSSFPWTL